MATLLRRQTLAATRLSITTTAVKRHGRPFFTLPTPPPQILTAREMLPYAAPKLYDIIADIDRYRHFLPYCTHSHVTHWTSPDANDVRRWPTQADLTAGWGGLTETYTSRVTCVPARGTVEARSGEAVLRALEEELGGGGKDGMRSRDGSGGIGGGESLFKSLTTRWTVTPLNGRQGDWSEIDLSIKYEFANPLYTAVSSAVAGKIAPKMIEAFVGEAKRVLGESKNN